MWQREPCSSPVPPGQHRLQCLDCLVRVTQETGRDANASGRRRIFRAVTYVDATAAQSLDYLAHLVTDAHHDEVRRALPIFETEARAHRIQALARFRDLRGVLRKELLILECR